MAPPVPFLSPLHSYFQMFRFSSFLAGATLLAGLGAAATAAANPTDTIQVKLSDGATMTLFVKNPEELRKLRAYKMDSLMVLLDRYITQAQAVSRNAGDAGRTTMEFSPAQDLHNPNAPEKLRVVVYNGTKTQPATTSTYVEVGRGLHVDVRETSDGRSSTHVRIGGADVHISDGTTGKPSRQVIVADSLADVRKDARKDSLEEVRRIGKDEERTDSYLAFGFGLNSLAHAGSAQFAGATDPTTVPVALDNWGSRYAQLGILTDTRILKPVRSAPFVRYGVQFAFNNYMLDGNRQWLNDEGTTKLVNAADGRQLQKSKLATAAVQVPVQLGVRFHNQKGKETLSVTAGGFTGYRLSARTKIKFDQDGDAKKFKERGGFNLEDFQYGLLGSISIFGHELFATYNLNELFRKDRGPQANVVAFGWNVLAHPVNFRSHKYGHPRRDAYVTIR